MARKRKLDTYSSDHEEYDTDGKYIDEGDGFIVSDGEVDDHTVDSEEEDEEEDEEEEYMSHTEDDDESEDENLEELLKEAGDDVNATAELHQESDAQPLRRGTRSRKTTKTFQDEFWGDEVKNLLLKDVTKKEYTDYMENDDDDPEVVTDDEDCSHHTTVESDDDDEFHSDENDEEGTE